MATVVQPLASITPAEQADRRRALDSSLGTTLAEGVAPSPEGMALGERYASGELSLEEYGAAVKALYGL